MKKIFNKPILIAGFIALTGIAAINSPFVTGNYFEITKNIDEAFPC